MCIRPATEADLPSMLEIYRPYVENTTYSFEYALPTLAEFTRRFRLLTAFYPWLVWEEDGQVLGYAYGSAPFERAAYRWCGEVSVYLHPQIHRRGIGSRLYRCLEAIMQQQGFRVLYALVTQENQGSLAFHKAAGYEKVAEFPACGYKHGRWLSVIWLEKAINSPSVANQSPISVDKIVNIDRFFCDF